MLTEQSERRWIIKIQSFKSKEHYCPNLKTRKDRFHCTKVQKKHGRFFALGQLFFAHSALYFDLHALPPSIRRHAERRYIWVVFAVVVVRRKLTRN